MTETLNVPFSNTEASILMEFQMYFIGIEIWINNLAFPYSIKVYILQVL